MPKIDINGIVYDMSEEEFALQIQLDAQAPYSDTYATEQDVSELKMLLAELSAKIAQLSGE